MSVPEACTTLSCSRPAVVLLLISHADPTRRARPYCGPCAAERREMFPDRVLDEVTIRENGSEHDVPYNRAVLVDVLIYHYRRDISGCGCGWAELGKSFPEHVATVYEESVTAREEGPPMSRSGDSGT